MLLYFDIHWAHFRPRQLYINREVCAKTSRTGVKSWTSSKGQRSPHLSDNICYIYFYSLITVSNLPSCTLDHFKSFDYFGCFRCLRWASSFHSDPLFLFVEDCQNKEKRCYLSCQLTSAAILLVHRSVTLIIIIWKNDKAKGRRVTCRFAVCTGLLWYVWLSVQ